MTSDNTLHGFGLEQARNINKATGLVLGTESGGRAGAPVNQTTAGVIVVELIADLPADDFDLHDARQVNWNGSDWAFVATVKVRKITAAAITAGSDDDPTRLFASVVGNLGLVVEQPGTGSSTTTTTGGGNSVRCCGCYDPDEWPAFDWGAGDEPVYYQLTGVSFGCCGEGATVLERQPDADEWTGDVVECADESLLTWTLTAAGVLTATHSVEGLVARYTRNPFDTDRFCAQRFDIDEDTTPIHDRDCTICGDEICLTPTRRFLTTDCFGDSQHQNDLPTAWRLTISEDGFDDRVGVLPFENYGSDFLGCTYANCNCEIGSWVFFHDVSGFGGDPNHWSLYATAAQGFGCVSCVPGAVTNGQIPIASWHDDDFDPRGVNSGVYGGATYKLEPL